MSQDATPTPQVVPTQADSKNPFDDDDFTALVEKAMKDWNIPGLAISVVDGDNVYAKVLSPNLTTTSTMH